MVSNRVKGILVLLVIALSLFFPGLAGLIMAGVIFFFILRWIYNNTIKNLPQNPHVSKEQELSLIKEELARIDGKIKQTKDSNEITKLQNQKQDLKQSLKELERS